MGALGLAGLHLKGTLKGHVVHDLSRNWLILGGTVP